MKATNRRTFLLTSAGSLAAYGGLIKTNHAMATAQPSVQNPPDNKFKETSVFYPAELMARAQANAKKYAWAAEAQ